MVFCGGRQQHPDPAKENARNFGKYEGITETVDSRDDRMIDTVATFGYTTDMQDNEGHQREAEILI